MRSTTAGQVAGSVFERALGGRSLGFRCALLASATALSAPATAAEPETSQSHAQPAAALADPTQIHEQPSTKPPTPPVPTPGSLTSTAPVRAVKQPPHLPPRTTAEPARPTATLPSHLTTGAVPPRGRSRTSQSAPLAAPPARVPPKATAHRLVWNYPRFRAWQYIASGVTSLTGFYFDSGISAEYPNNGWNDGILLDNRLRSGLRASTVEGRARAARISDAMWHITQYYPVVIDGLFVPLVTDKLNVDVALQMTLLNWQAQGLTFLVLRVAHRTVGRARPPLRHCAEDPEYDGVCSPDYRGESASFFSGHSAMTGAAAGLVCAHHQALPLYGGNVFDSAICGAMIASSLVTGSLRVVNDRHWSSDVAFGWIVGGAIGYGIPYFLHYGQRSRALDLGFLPKNSLLVPYAASNALGLTWVGIL